MLAAKPLCLLVVATHKEPTLVEVQLLAGLSTRDIDITSVTKRLRCNGSVSFILSAHIFCLDAYFHLLHSPALGRWPGCIYTFCEYTLHSDEAHCWQFFQIFIEGAGNAELLSGSFLLLVEGELGRVSEVGVVVELDIDLRLEELAVLVAWLGLDASSSGDSLESEDVIDLLKCNFLHPLCSHLFSDHFC